tara:strand:- start:1394 stop:2203 length:810 start_codon:yes stop_codon:yes gene_type:complete
MAIAKVNFQLVNDTNAAAPAASAWTELQVADFVANSGGHTSFTHGAGSNGFTNRVVLDASISSGILSTANSAYLDYDTGINMSDLYDNKTVALSIMLTCNVAPANAIWADGTSKFCVGTYGFNTTFGGGPAMGFFTGVNFNLAFSIPNIHQCAIKRSSDTAANGVGTVAGFVPTADTFVGFRQCFTGRKVFTSANGNQFGFAQSDTGGQYIDSSLSNNVQDSTQHPQLVSGLTSAAGNLHIGAIFSQNGTGGSAKTLDFNLYYALAQLS